MLIQTKWFDEQIENSVILPLAQDLADYPESHPWIFEFLKKSRRGDLELKDLQIVGQRVGLVFTDLDELDDFLSAIIKYLEYAKSDSLGYI